MGDGDQQLRRAANAVRALAVDAVEAALKRKFDDGMVYEREVFLDLMWTPECRALRHAFLAERAASKIPDVPEGTPQRTIAQVAVIGAGTVAGLREGHVHDVIIIKEAPNYRTDWE